MLVGASYIGVLSGLNTVVQLRAPEAVRGRILSIYMTALGVIYPIGLIIEGAIGQAIGIRLMTVISGVLLAAMIGALRLFRPSVLRSLGPVEVDERRDTSVAEVAEIDLGARLEGER